MSLLWASTNNPRNKCCSSTEIYIYLSWKSSCFISGIALRTNTAGGPEHVSHACSHAWSLFAYMMRMNPLMLSLLKPFTTALLNSVSTKVKPSFLQKVLLQLRSVKPVLPTWCYVKLHSWLFQWLVTCYTA